MTYDFCIIGGGIIGLSTALAIQTREPNAKILVLEKEEAIALHQTTHNSGVIHAGVYYQPGSLKARLCREGSETTKQFCRENNIAFDECGKLIIATNAIELGRLDALEERVIQNGIVATRLSKNALQTAEPWVTGVGALLVPSTGIVDYGKIAHAMASALMRKGGEIRCNSAVTAIDEEAQSVQLRVGDTRIFSRKLVACAGLQSDRIARLASQQIEHQIVPFRGEYYILPQAMARRVKHLIYPVPDPNLPFLGIHLTRTIDGGMTVGPNAVLGFAREGYAQGRINRRDVCAMISFPGFWRMAAQNWRSAFKEFALSISQKRYLAACQKYCPALERKDLMRPIAGIRAQAVRNDGTLVHDFLFISSDRILHVCNAPSPAATSAIPIGRMITDQLFGMKVT